MEINSSSWSSAKQQHSCRRWWTAVSTCSCTRTTVCRRSELTWTSISGGRSTWRYCNSFNSHARWSSASTAFAPAASSRCGCTMPSYFTWSPLLSCLATFTPRHTLKRSVINWFLVYSFFLRENSYAYTYKPKKKKKDTVENGEILWIHKSCTFA